MDTVAGTDSIERSIDIQAPRTRVWQALANAEEFGKWFGADLTGQAFVPGDWTRGQITQPGYDHLAWQARVDRVEPEHLLSLFWHPYAVDTAVDYSKEEPTLVTFRLQDTPSGGTRLTVTESGFDRVPAHRRLEAWRMNSTGWEVQLANIMRHVDG